jgi:hypothetical protein
MIWKDPAPRTREAMQEVEDAIKAARERFGRQAGEFVFYTQSEFVRDAPGDVIVGEVVE